MHIKISRWPQKQEKARATLGEQKAAKILLFLDRAGFNAAGPG
jgi:hypothetical protein